MKARDLLAAHIMAAYLNEAAFCKKNNFDPSMISRILSGDRGNRISAQLAWDIAQATNGTVPIEAWIDTKGD